MKAVYQCEFRYREVSEFVEGKRYYYLMDGRIEYADAKKSEKGGRFYAYKPKWKGGCVPVYLDTVMTSEEKPTITFHPDQED
jgi:hypothetical protein